MPGTLRERVNVMTSLFELHVTSLEQFVNREPEHTKSEELHIPKVCTSHDVSAHRNSASHASGRTCNTNSCSVEIEAITVMRNDASLSSISSSSHSAHAVSSAASLAPTKKAKHKKHEMQL
jgi:hypothetical protein